MSINYSVSKRTVTGHKDTEKCYASSQIDNEMDINAFAEHIAAHGSVYSRDIIAGVLMKAVDCMREKLLEGYRIQLGDLGSFYPSIANKSYTLLPDEPDDYKPNLHIAKLNVIWSRGKKMKDLLADAGFTLVAHRSAQTALLAAVKAGENTVDITKKPSSSGGTTGGDTSTGDGGSSSDNSGDGGSDNNGGGDDNAGL